MKSRVLVARALALCTLMVSSAFTLSAQSFTTTMSDPSTISGTPTTALEHRGVLKNNSASAKIVVVRYYNSLKYVEHVASMCTADLCYELPDNFGGAPYDLPVFTLASGDSIALKAILNPVGAEGTSTLRFNIFDQENPSDSVPYQMTFIIDKANTVKDLSDVATVEVAPNPSSDRVAISSPILSQATNLVVYATDGRIVRTQTHDGSQRIVVDVSVLSVGSYHVILTLTSGDVYRTPISVVR